MYIYSMATIEALMENIETIIAGDERDRLGVELSLVHSKRHDLHHPIFAHDAKVVARIGGHVAAGKTALEALTLLRAKVIAHMRSVTDDVISSCKDRIRKEEERMRAMELEMDKVK
jgi:hypothetical protein